GRFELCGHFLEQLVSSQVAKLVVDLFEAVEVAKEHRQGTFRTADAPKFVFQMEADGSGVGKFGEVVGAGGALSLFVLESVLDGKAEFGTCGQQHAEMLFCERVFLAVVEREHTRDAFTAAEGDRE